ncbi:MAG: M14 family zinc carboxypeptidase [bacterium]
MRSYRNVILSFLAITSGLILLAGISSKKTAHRIDVRIFTPTKKDSVRLKVFNIKIKGKTTAGFVDAEVSESELEKIRRSGFQVALISELKKNTTIPPSYRPLEEIERKLRYYQSKYSEIYSLEKIGKSTAQKRPIWGVKISDNAEVREDEPRILFVGVHHAREPIGANICLEIIRALCSNYGRDKRITSWVNSLEIWLVPVVNPDGYQYVMNSDLSFPWWRKNLRDNDRNGKFNPLYDGVDLNRNYEYNWNEGGDGKPSSWFYRGSRPFSESETRAIQELAMRENFLFGVSYHSYGESILFPWGNYHRPPDIELIVEVASQMASRIKKESGHGHYAILPLNGRVGQSSIWMYAELNIMDYIVEVGTEYFPAEKNIPDILKENLKGAFYLFDRAFGSGITGHVFDMNTLQPLLAEVEVKQFAARYVKPRKSDAHFGGFYRLLKPGTFTLEINSNGYKTKIIKNVRVKNGEMTQIEIGMHKIKKNITNGISN